MFRIFSFNQLISSVIDPIYCVVDFLNQKIKNIAKAIFTPMLALPSNAKSLLNRVTTVYLENKALYLENKALKNELLEWKRRLPENEKADADFVIKKIMEKGINTTELNLYLYGCSSLTSMPDSIGRLTNLTRLGLMGCSGLTSIPDAIGSLTKLTNLSLNDCRGLKSIPETIGSLTKLTNLSLDHCRGLTRIPETIGSLTELTDLSLNDCRGLTSIPETIVSLTKLTNLSLNDCMSLTSIPDSIGRLTNLTRLGLSGCPLTSIPETIGSLTKLTYLDLSRCRLTSIPETIGSLTNLTYLHLSGCPLTSIPDSIGSLTKLTNLSLNDCMGLTSIPEAIGSLTNLTNLSLNRCRLTSLPASILNLPARCTLELENTGLSQNVLDRLRGAVQAGGYNGPRISYSMAHANPISGERNFSELVSFVCAKAKKEQKDFAIFKDEENVRAWLNRLSWTAEGKNSVNQKSFYEAIYSTMVLAEENDEFKELFLAVLQEASTTCGDRVALSVLKLGVIRNRFISLQSSNKQAVMKAFKDEFIISCLEECARQKIPTLRFFDEIEVYLAYPIKLRERLGLSLDVSDMLYFACASITGADLNAAYDYVQGQLEGRLTDHLIELDDWKKALEKFYPDEMSAANLINQNACEVEDETTQASLRGQYLDKLREITQNFAS